MSRGLDVVLSHVSGLKQFHGTEVHHAVHLAVGDNSPLFLPLSLLLLFTPSPSLPRGSSETMGIDSRYCSRLPIYHAFKSTRLLLESFNEIYDNAIPRAAR